MIINISIYLIFRVTSSKVTPALDTKQNENTENASSNAAGVGVIVAFVLVLMVIATATGWLLYRRKKNALKGNILLI